MKRDLLDKVLDCVRKEVNNKWYSIQAREKERTIEILKIQAGIEIEEEDVRIKQGWHLVGSKYANGKTDFYVNNEKVDDLNKYFDAKEEDYLAEANNVQLNFVDRIELYKKVIKQLQEKQ